MAHKPVVAEVQGPQGGQVARQVLQGVQAVLGQVKGHQVGRVGGGPGVVVAQQGVVVEREGLKVLQVVQGSTFHPLQKAVVGDRQEFNPEMGRFEIQFNINLTLLYMKLQYATDCCNLKI